ncbi:MAG: TIGR00730 family Rossman fold protein [Muribaculaceae bacterium]|nr:TIGR00730 family Rossman fold protein [Muribaculaceae bacterium]
MEQERTAITVYCASSPRLEPIFHKAAEALGREIALSGAQLVYGGGRSGLMGRVADSVLEAGGAVTGVIPRFMYERGWGHDGLQRLDIVDSMHTRKEAMMRMAKGVVALPGGIGTFEELLEAITWRELRLFDGNIAIYNVDGYFDPLISMLESAAERGFMRTDRRNLYRVVSTAREAVEYALGVEPTAL